jgi:hypothetical protein
VALTNNSNCKVIIVGFVRHIRFYVPAIMFYEYSGYGLRAGGPTFDLDFQ